MKKIYITFSETKDGKNYAYADTIRAGENLMNFVRPTTQIMHICETAIQAWFIAVEWNKAYINNGTYMYEE